MKREHKALYQRALETWGSVSQMDMAAEECAELIVKVQHVKRGRATMNELIDEIADVSIMMEQMKLVVGPKRVQVVIEKKLERLSERLEAVMPLE